MNTRSTLKGSRIGVGLANARIAIGMTQQEVADKIGRRQTNISSWELGRSEPDLETFLQLLELYGVYLEDVIGGVPHPATISEEEMQLVLRFRSLSAQNKEAIEAIMCVYQKYQQ